MNITITQPKRYSSGETGDYTYTVPAYDQDYVINLSYPEVNIPEASYSGLAFPDYKTSTSSNLIEEHAYNWTGLREEEKQLFEQLFARFNNSWQPFTLTYNSRSDQFIISKEPAIERDRIGLYSINLTLLKYE